MFLVFLSGSTFPSIHSRFSVVLFLVTRCPQLPTLSQSPVSLPVAFQSTHLTGELLGLHCFHSINIYIFQLYADWLNYHTVNAGVNICLWILPLASLCGCWRLQHWEKRTQLYILAGTTEISVRKAFRDRLIKMYSCLLTISYWCELKHRVKGTSKIRQLIFIEMITDSIWKC